uniref:COG complex component COG2 C-terminal domain-containing protein n=1 Tax=Pseudo-nitzschia arenysensis TaxID=697910 RepID=A0A7R9ZUC0_9STRA|mmetsp:Transcript_82/g.210  ORF Transcript_82/g.210 Transcript_82/m.210 type:complete len:828 (+) Transcript_82:175-2658(+)
MTESTSDFIPTAMSTSALENKLKDLKEKSIKQSQVLTAKLASSQSGQNLLHIGTSLQTLPPDLHSLLTQLHPVLSCTESAEKEYLQRLQKLVDCGNDIRFEERRVGNARECAGLYEDLVAAENRLRKDPSQTREKVVPWAEGDSYSSGLVDQVSMLERCAQTTLFLVKELQASNDIVAAMTATNAILSSDPSSNSLPSMRTSLDQDSERAQFLMKLAPRIRRLESDTISALSFWTEQILKRIQDQKRFQKDQQLSEEKIENAFETPSENDLQLMIGHCMRGLALLGRGKEVENIFARVAIMPLIRSKISIGRLDEGGPRGECTGLKSLLEDIVVSVAGAFGPVLELAEVMFDLGTKVEVDLITGGVWVPIATALMTDAGIKMAIFSPGIASILQSNYTVLDKFLSELASRLLASQDADVPRSSQATIDKSSTEKLYFTPKVSAKSARLAQERIYSHAKTAEFSKKWNLPIYYQLRFGDCCTRLNKAIGDTTRDGWTADVFSGDAAAGNTLRNDVGFELSFFLELYDILQGLWRPDVILRPLTNRFLRGAVQLIGRSVAFIKDGMVGELKFGEDTDAQNGDGNVDDHGPGAPLTSSKPYSWGDSAPDVAAVAWELAILETSLSHDYVSTVCATMSAEGTKNSEIRPLVSEVLKDASAQIHPLVERAWNEIIVKLLIEKCSGVLGAVKGVVATYRMTNRPPPTQASPYVKTILRPLKEFSDEVSLRIPDYIGNKWKVAVLTEITSRYSVAVEELITTVRRTEVALQNRRTRRVASGGVSDGDKVKLQLFLDFEAFCRDMQEVGVDPSSVTGITKLKDLTKEGAGMVQEK